MKNDNKDLFITIESSDMFEENALELIKGGVSLSVDCNCGDGNSNKGGDCNCGGGNSNKGGDCNCGGGNTNTTSALVFG